MGALPEGALDNVRGDNVKVLVGIPSYNNADTIAYVAEVAAEGISKFFEGKGIVVNSDGGSTDGTREVFMKADTGEIQKISFEYEGVPGKGSAMRAVFEVADRLGADAIVFLDSDLRSVKPWWLERLAMPIVSGLADYVSPYYIRHKYDATITNHICYPMTAILYGKKVRQPIGGDFGVGRKAYRIYLEKPEEIWKSNVAKFGIDIWMTTTAIAENLSVMQAALGAKVHDVKDPGKHLGPMFLQVVSTLFSLMVEYENVWNDIEAVEEVQIYGDMPEAQLEEIVVDLENLRKKASLGVKEYENQLRSFLDEQIIEGILQKGELNAEDWVEATFSFAKAFKESRSEEIVQMMIPVYFARVAGFVEATKELSTEEAENVVEEQLYEFFSKKSKLKSIWF